MQGLLPANIRLTLCYANVSYTSYYLVAVPNENPAPVLVEPRVPDPKLKPDIFYTLTLRVVLASAIYTHARRPDRHHG